MVPVGGDAPGGQGGGPPASLVRALVGGPTLVRALRWLPRTTSTNDVARAAAAAGAPEIHLVVADTQTAGRGRRGRAWLAPAGTSLLLSAMLRPQVAAERLGLLPLLAGLCLADAVAAHVPGVEVGGKWPNDLLVRRSGQPWRKAAGVLSEALPGAVVVGVGCNVDWRGVARPAELQASAVSLAEVAGHDVDRWRLLAAFAGLLDRRYRQWQADPGAFLPAYRDRCLTLGRRVRVQRPTGAPLEGTAVDVDDRGRLQVRTAAGVVAVTAGDVVHLRPADAGT